jgi:DNA-binding SARP family transcriptional activator/TolB-like protein
MPAEFSLNPPSHLLRFLGTPQIEGEHGLLEGGVVQRHRIALLALLALAPRGILPRDRLMAFLWPEASTDNARNLLNAAVHAVRRSLGEEVLITQGNGVRLDSSGIRIDIKEFELAIQKNEFGRAVEMYTGPFLDGLALPDAVEFEHWHDHERGRLERLYHRALEQQAEAVDRDRGPAEAVDLWRRRLSCTPTDGRIVLRLMQILAASGDRAGALRAAGVHATLLQSEFGTPPDNDVEALADELRHAPPHEAISDPTTQNPTRSSAHAVTPTRDLLPQRVIVLDSARRANQWHKALLAIGLLGFFFLAFWLASQSNIGNEVSRNGIAVLVCNEIPPIPANEYLVLGITEQVINELSRSSVLSPIALTSVMRYRGTDRDIRTIANDLNVGTILDCMIRQNAADFHVTFSLINASTQTHIWGQPYTVALEDIGRFERDLAQRVAEGLNTRLNPDGRQSSAVPGTASEDAWFDYLRGRQFTRTTERELEIAISYFERAIGADPEFALAHAGLADAILSLGAFGLWPPREARDSARAAAQRALTFDDNLPEGIAALAGVLLWFDWDWTGAEEAFKRARDLQPTSITARHSFASLLIALRRFDEASDLLRENVDLDPLNPYTHAVLGWAYYMGGQYTDAISQLEQTRVRFPESAAGEVPLAWSYAALGRFSEAIAAADRADASLRDDPWLSTSLAAVRAAAGRRTDAESTLTWLSDLQTRRYVDPRNFAVLLGVLGDTARALSELERAYHLGSPEMVFLDVNRAALFHSAFGTTPRYEALVRQLRFPR